MAGCASTDDIARLNRAMTDLEAMLGDIEGVGSILDFGVVDGDVSERNTFRTADTGPRVLASEVSEELRKWQVKKQAEIAKESQAILDRLQKTARARKEEEKTREVVRMLVRRRLYDLASNTMREAAELQGVLGEPTTNQAPRLGGFQDAIFRSAQLSRHGQSASLSTEALTTLRLRLASVVQVVLGLRADPPPEMAEAVAASASALQRKGERGSTRAARLPEIASNFDAQLLEHAENGAMARRTELTEQFTRQVFLMKHLREAASDREESLEDPDGQPAASLRERANAGPWRALWPGGVAKDVEESGDVRPRAPPQLPDNAEEIMEANLKTTLLEHGEARVKDICQEIQQNYLAEGSTTRIRVASVELERWQLSTKLQLLDDVLSFAEKCHKAILVQLRGALNHGMDDTSDQMTRVMSAADEFRARRTDAISHQLDESEKGLQRYTRKCATTMQAARRRVEIASLKRWVDVIAGNEETQQSYDKRCLHQLGDAAHQLVVDVHSALPLPTESFSTDRGKTAVEPLLRAWTRANVPIPQQMALLERIANKLSNTITSCAAAKAALCVVDSELKRLLSEPLQVDVC